MPFNHPESQRCHSTCFLKTLFYDELLEKDVYFTITLLPIVLQVHCISTEFTARKHGGEKGVPFRIQIDTYALGANGKLGKYIHSASCQIKVFKPKGADRKLKTDKDKMEKRSAQDKLKYQPSYDSTLLSECMPTPLSNEQVSEEQPTQTPLMEQITEMVPVYSNSVAGNTMCSVDRKSLSKSNSSISSNMSTSTKPSFRNAHSSFSSPVHDILLPSSTLRQTQEWLERNRFGNFIKTLSNFSAVDLLALSRADVIQICGPSDGIRLYNSLRAKTFHPRLTLYLTSVVRGSGDNLPIYQAFYLEQASIGELAKAVNHCLFEDHNNRVHIARILYQPQSSNIHVLVTDEVVAQMKDESSFNVSLIKHESMDSYQVILKPQN